MERKLVSTSGLSIKIDWLLGWLSVFKLFFLNYYSLKDKLRRRALIVGEVEEGAIVVVDTGAQIEGETEELGV